MTLAKCLFRAGVGLVLATVFGGFALAQPNDPLGDPEIQRHIKTGSSSLGLGDVPQPTSEVVLQLKKGTGPVEFALSRGIRFVRSLRGAASWSVFRLNGVSQAQRFVERCKTDPLVMAAANNARTANKRMSFAPDDPFFFSGSPNGFPGEWYLVNGNSSIDAGVQGAWTRDLTGLGIVIATVDDCLQTNHPDLSPNFDAADSFDFGQNDPNPDPVHASDEHGVCVAGVAAARGGNGIGVTGTAPWANIAGLRVDFDAQTVAMFVNATLYHSSGSNTSIKVKNHSYGQSPPYGFAGAETDAVEQSAQSGTIHIFSAGNERGSSEGGEDSNKKMPQSSPSVITVAALGSNGKFASYSSFGANVFVTAPSSGSGLLRIVTTDRMTKAFGYNGNPDSFPDADYTSLFGGTSSAAPVVSGVMALGKQAQPGLNVRFAKHILALSSTIVDGSDATEASDGGWKTNAAGYKFNQNYGFGLINADKFTQMAAAYGGVSPLAVEVIGLQNINQPIPDNSLSGIATNFTINSQTPLEEMQVYLNVTHTFRGDVEAFLTSPSGTTGRLMLASGQDDGNNIDWTFTSNAFWGENPHGVWVLTVRDVASGDTGTWNSFNVGARMGSLIQPQGQVQSVTFFPGVAYGGSRMKLIGTVTLNQPAPQGGQTVSLSSSNTAIATVSTSVTIPAGAVSTTFNVNAKAVSNPATVGITGSTSSSSALGSVIVLPNPLKTLVVSPKQVIGGSAINVRGTVALIGPAGPSGAVVTLQSSDPSIASVPATVLVPSGYTKASFVISHHAVNSAKVLQIGASALGVTRERNFTVSN